jgi:5-methylcytosine-specific restriction endonuclease McrA
LEIEHIVARGQGGSDRASNLCLACYACNQKKAKRPLAEFRKNDPERVGRILAMAKAASRDAAAVNATR